MSADLRDVVILQTPENTVNYSGARGWLCGRLTSQQYLKVCLQVLQLSPDFDSPPRLKKTIKIFHIFYIKSWPTMRTLAEIRALCLRRSCAGILCQIISG